MTQAQKHQPIIVSVARRKLLRAQRASLLLGAGLTCLAILPWRPTWARQRWLLALARILLASWGWWSAPTLWRLLARKPLVVVSDEGIQYHAPRVYPFAFDDTLPWSDIRALYIAQAPRPRSAGGAIKHRLLCIVPNDVDAFLRPMSVMNMTLRAIVMRQTGSPFLIADTLSTLGNDELLARIRSDYADLIERYEIELREEYAAPPIGER